MSEKQVKNTVTEEIVASEEPKEIITQKPNRRGLGSAKGTQRLKFSHRDAIPQNGLFIGILESVSVSSIAIGEDKTGTPSFNGLDIPKLTLTFTSNDADATKRKYITHSFTAVESNVETIPGGKSAWKVDAVMNWLKHILNVFYLKGRELTEDEELALSLSFNDFDENGEYVPIEPEVVIEAWKVLFENFENILNRGKDNLPIFKDKANKNIPIWMKLLRFTKIKNVWRSVVSGNSAGDLGFTPFIGEGVIELYKTNVPPSISINVINETILPREIEKPKAPNANYGMPNVTGLQGSIAIPTMDHMQSYNADTNINVAASEDLPF